MNKQEFLETLTEEQLNLLRDITDKDVMQELEKQNSKKIPIEVNVDDCFIYINDYNSRCLTKVISRTNDQYFDCEEISIDNYNIDIYEVNYYINDFEKHDRIDSEIFNKIAALVNTRDDAVYKICEEFNKQIRELCSTLLNKQQLVNKIEEYVKKENK